MDSKWKTTKQVCKHHSVSGKIKTLQLIYYILVGKNNGLRYTCPICDRLLSPTKGIMFIMGLSWIIPAIMIPVLLIWSKHLAISGLVLCIVHILTIFLVLFLRALLLALLVRRSKWTVVEWYSGIESPASTWYSRGCLLSLMLLTTVLVITYYIR